MIRQPPVKFGEHGPQQSILHLLSCLMMHVNGRINGLFGNNTYKGVDARWQTDDNAAAAEPFIGAKYGIAVQTRVKDRVSTFKEIRPQPFLLKTPRFWRQDGGDGEQLVRVTVAGARFGVNTRTNPPCQRRCKLQKAVPSNIRIKNFHRLPSSCSCM